MTLDADSTDDPVFWDRQGQPLSMRRANDLLGDPDYTRVALTELPPGNRVSTIWLGVDFGWGEERRLIFETVTFSGAQALEVHRWSTEEEAVEGHLAVVRDLTSNLGLESIPETSLNTSEEDG